MSAFDDRLIEQLDKAIDEGIALDKRVVVLETREEDTRKMGWLIKSALVGIIIERIAAHAF